jgi:competence protein ComEA
MQSRVRQLLSALTIAALVAAVAPSATRAGEGESRLDLNRASVSELASLPGIGESKAKAIVEYRAAEPFRTVDDLKKVKGIGDKTFESLRPSITVGVATDAP